MHPSQNLNFTQRQSTFCGNSATGWNIELTFSKAGIQWLKFCSLFHHIMSVKLKHVPPPTRGNLNGSGKWYIQLNTEHFAMTSMDFLLYYWLSRLARIYQVKTHTPAKPQLTAKNCCQGTRLAHSENTSFSLLSNWIVKVTEMYTYSVFL